MPSWFPSMADTYLKSAHGIYLKVSMSFRGSRPEWCISSMIYGRDIPFWLETLDLYSSVIITKLIGLCCWYGLQDSTSHSAAAPESTAKPKKVESWQKSVGTLSSKKGLVGLVKKKPASKTDTTKTSSSYGTQNTNTPSSNSASADRQVKPQGDVEISAPNGITKTAPATGGDEKQSVSTGLGLLGGYSDSESDSS